MKNVLITGGLGFIGYHLTKQLLTDDKNIKITIIDNLSSSKVDFEAKLFVKLNVIVKDLKEIDWPQYKFDLIYHLASPVGSIGILKNNGYIAKEIIDLTYKIIEITKKSGAKLLFVSSSEIYGHDGKHPESAQKCLTSKIGTRSEYALGKLTAEVILQNIALDSKIDFNIVRPFNVIGEQQSSFIGFVVPRFFESALCGKDLDIFYDGTQMRSFSHVNDIVNAMIKIQESSISGEIFNIGNEKNLITINELAEKIINICNSESQIKYIDPVKLYGKCYIEAFNKIPNIDKINKLLNWTPLIGLDEALIKIYNYYMTKDESIICKSILQN